MRIAAIKNISAIHLKHKEWTKCVDKCSSILSLNGNDLKSLFRRAVSYRKLHRYAEAIQDLERANRVSPTPSKEIKVELELNRILALNNGQSNMVESVNVNVVTQQKKAEKDVFTKFGFKPSSMFQLERIPFKGYGLTAKQGIKRGAVILKETPFITFQGNKEISRNQIENELENVTQSEYEIFKSLSHSKSITNSYGHVLMDIVQQNSIQMTQSKSGLFAVCSRFNHSCKPNVFWHWNTHKKCQFVGAARDIAENEELLVNYVSMKRHSTRNKRREHLMKTYGFYCECTQCDTIDVDACTVFYF